MGALGERSKEGRGTSDGGGSRGKPTQGTTEKTERHGWGNIKRVIPRRRSYRKRGKEQGRAGAFSKQKKKLLKKLGRYLFFEQKEVIFGGLFSHCFFHLVSCRLF